GVTAGHSVTRVSAADIGDGPSGTRSTHSCGFAVRSRYCSGSRRERRLAWGATCETGTANGTGTKTGGGTDSGGRASVASTAAESNSDVFGSCGPCPTTAMRGGGGTGAATASTGL